MWGWCRTLCLQNLSSLSWTNCTTKIWLHCPRSERNKMLWKKFGLNKYYKHSDITYYPILPVGIHLNVTPKKTCSKNLELQFCLSMRDIWGNHKISVSIFANEKKMLFARIYFWELQVNYTWSKQQSFWSNEWDHKWLKYAKFRKNKTKPSFKLNCLSYQKYSFFKYELENVQS